MNISLYVPELEDYWYEQKLLSDDATMSYNAGFNVSYDGYHYDTGCIDFDESKWKTKYEARKKQSMFFAYIKDNSLDKFIGFCNYQYNESENIYECGLVIASDNRGKGYSKEALILLCNEARRNGIKKLYDSFEIERNNTLKVFESVGFKVERKITIKRFDKNLEGVVVKIDL